MLKVLVGLSVVNALSEWMIITVTRDGFKYQIGFEKGIKVQDVTVVEEGLDVSEHGTEVTFKPDYTVWKEDDIFDLDSVEERLKTLSILNPGLGNYLYISENEEVIKEETFYFEEGLKVLIENKTIGKTKIMEPLIIQGVHNGVEVYVGMTYTDSYDTERIFSFCNNAETKDHGDHVTGLKAGLAKALTKYATEHKGNVKFDNSDILEGLTAIVSIKVQDPNFDGQGKARLRMTSVRQATNKLLFEHLDELFDCNPTLAKAILAKIEGASKAREAAQKAREASRKIKENSSSNGSMPGKLAACTSKDPNVCELFIVEGDSAGGSAKQGRDRMFQAILPAFGKPLNVEKKRMHQVVASEKIMEVSNCIGGEIGPDYNADDSNYIKVIIMSDADVDGSHIKTLWATYFYRYMRDLIAQGKVYFSCPPLFKVVVGKDKVYYAANEEEREKLIEQYGSKITIIQRFKGLIASSYVQQCA